MRLILISLISTLMYMPLASATLVDNGNYTTDTTNALDWLDLNATLNRTLTQALNENISDGWSFATDSQITGLLAEFGITYQYNGGITALTASDSIVGEFTTLLGLTSGNASIGTYSNSVAGHATFLCISLDTCSPGSFTRDIDLTASADSNVGSFLVRDSVSSVPIPTAIWLMGSGLVGLMGFSRKKKS